MIRWSRPPTSPQDSGGTAPMAPAGRPLSPTGGRLVWPITNIFQFDDDGRLIEEWVQYDNRSLFRQLGVEAGD